MRTRPLRAAPLGRWPRWPVHGGISGMTTILGRYIFRQAAGAVIMILVSLTVVIWVAVALRQLEFMASQGQTVGLFFKLTTLAFRA